MRLLRGRLPDSNNPPGQQELPQKNVSMILVSFLSSLLFSSISYFKGTVIFTTHPFLSVIIWQ